VVEIEFRWKRTGDKGGPPARHNKAQLQMKFRQISFFMAGLLSFGAMAQVQPPKPATNPPMPAPPVPAAAGGVVGPPAPGSPAPASPANPAPAAPTAAPDRAQLSRALGISYSQLVSNNMVCGKGVNLKTDVDMGLFIQAFSNVMAGVPETTNMDELRQVLGQWDAYYKEKLMATGLENKAKGEKFMDEMAATPGATKLASGVVYKVIKDGDGIKPTAADAATMSFRVKLIDNTEVLKVEHYQSMVAVQALPPGIREVLLLMKAGSHWMVYLPNAQAYGEKAMVPVAQVGPYSALIFDLELESVQSRPAMPGMPPGMMPPPRGAAPAPAAPTSATPATVPASPITSSIVRVPSSAEMEKGEQPRTMTDAEVEAAKAAEARKALTNTPIPK